jgi:hypothetical protein
MELIVESGFIIRMQEKNNAYVKLHGIIKMQAMASTVNYDNQNSDDITFDILKDLFILLICCLSITNFVLIAEILYNFLFNRPSLPRRHHRANTLKRVAFNPLLLLSFEK